MRCAEGPLTTPSLCDFHAVFSPSAQLGASCVDSRDCVSGFCFGTSLECRTCRPFAGLGQQCSSSARCDPAVHFCSLATRTCTALLADGAPCGASAECATSWCNWSSQVSDAGPDRCGRLPLGAGCGDPGDCVDGAWCEGYAFDGDLVTAGVCAPRRALGQPCTNTPDDDGCVEPATCLEGRCALVAPYSLDAGSECERLTDCEESAFCLGREAAQPDGGRSLRAGVCTPRRDAGAPCDYLTYVDTDCSAATTCGRDALCVPRGDADAGCRSRAECRDFLSCPAMAARCTPFASPGQPCELNGSVCLDSWCGESAPGASLSCQPLLVDGASCPVLGPAQCASGRCSSRDGGATSCQAACL